MKQKMKHHLRIAILLLGTLTCFTSCQKDDFKDPVEETGESRVKRISLSDFNNKVGNSKDYKELSRLFDVNKLKSKNAQGRLVESDSATIATDEILMIEREDKIFYTFTIKTTTTNETGSFYNLLVVTSLTGDIDNTKIFEYTPSETWLQDKTQPFSGFMKLHENDIFNDDYMNNSFLSRGSGECLIGVGGHWECEDGFPDAPGTCNANSYSWVVTGTYGPCPPELTQEEDDNGVAVGPGSSGNGGGGSGSGSNNNSDDDDCVPSIDNPCDDDETVVIPPRDQDENTTHEKNCEELNKLTSPPGYNQPNPFIDDNHPGNTDGLNTNPRLAIVNADQSLNNDVETGFSLRNDGIFVQTGPYAKYMPANNQTHGVDFHSYQNQYGTVHTHPSNSSLRKWIPMFSVDDIYSVLQIRNLYTSSPFLNSLNPNGDSLFVSVFIAEQNGNAKTYALKIDDITKFQSLMTIKNNKRKWKKLKKELLDKYIDEANDHLGTELQYQRVLLEFIQENDLGVSLYKMEQTNQGTPQVQETWKKLKLGLEDTIIDSQC
ncbi:hypothetical protein [Psychroserpens damuponensis]|uniref:hypothetical protein n=1 Tax=Psychroserpens damuponensis TaxID=943936 RepID=UPI00058DEE10|nr:hypothetical protein [Psychroserpens damuponensis]